MYEVIIPKSVQKELDKISEIYYLKIRDKIFELETNPRPVGCIKLSDFEEYRIRVGNFRILFDINDKEKKVIIYKIQDRKEIYKKR